MGVRALRSTSEVTFVVATHSLIAVLTWNRSCSMLQQTTGSRTSSSIQTRLHGHRDRHCWQCQARRHWRLQPSSACAPKQTADVRLAVAGYSESVALPGLAALCLHRHWSHDQAYKTRRAPVLLHHSNAAGKVIRQLAVLQLLSCGPGSCRLTHLGHLVVLKQQLSEAAAMPHAKRQAC